MGERAADPRELLPRTTSSSARRVDRFSRRRLNVRRSPDIESDRSVYLVDLALRGSSAGFTYLNSTGP